VRPDPDGTYSTNDRVDLVGTSQKLSRPDALSMNASACSRMVEASIGHLAVREQALAFTGDPGTSAKLGRRHFA
jgi:hypothetical protein